MLRKVPCSPLRQQAPVAAAKTNVATGTRRPLFQFTPAPLLWTASFDYHVTPRIICERLLVDPVEVNPVEYGFHCFGGEPRFVRVHKNRATNLTVASFPIDWQRPPFVVIRPSSGKVVDPPPNFAEMVSIARRLAHGWPFVRVDLYGIAGRTVFSEMTLSPGAGSNRFIPESYEYYWGHEIPLPSRPHHRDVPATMPRALSQRAARAR